MTVSEIRTIIEEVLIDRGLDDDEALETTDAIIDAFNQEGLLDDYYEESPSDDEYLD